MSKHYGAGGSVMVLKAAVASAAGGVGTASSSSLLESVFYEESASASSTLYASTISSVTPSGNRGRSWRKFRFSFLSTLKSLEEIVTLVHDFLV
ncbi:hypothetical protein L3X38_024956 [Prunus dulcis]|uniref:Uncharacterized protein n=1 Tax=Prunus dulcis TaxID=3755 RepID=A0AAD4Z7K0_PRUDU|nr:hypothetical protein L3X38_024956 [Prunus dulcis]